jgi:hypothetical protein
MLVPAPQTAAPVPDELTTTIAPVPEQAPQETPVANDKQIIGFDPGIPGQDRTAVNVHQGKLVSRRVPGLFAAMMLAATVGMSLGGIEPLPSDKPRRRS